MNTNLNMQTTALSLLLEIFAPSAFFSVFSEEVSVTLPDDLKGATACRPYFIYQRTYPSGFQAWSQTSSSRWSPLG